MPGGILDEALAALLASGETTVEDLKAALAEMGYEIAPSTGAGVEIEGVGVEAAPAAVADEVAAEMAPQPAAADYFPDMQPKRSSAGMRGMKRSAIARHAGKLGK